MFALAAQHGLKMRGLDIYGAFITAFIDSPVYLQLPKGLRPARYPWRAPDLEA